MDVNVKNYVTSQEYWLSVTPEWHVIKYKDSGNAQEHTHTHSSASVAKYSWVRLAGNEPVSIAALAQQNTVLFFSTAEHSIHSGWKLFWECYWFELA